MITIKCGNQFRQLQHPGAGWAERQWPSRLGGALHGSGAQKAITQPLDLLKKPNIALAEAEFLDISRPVFVITGGSSPSRASWQGQK